MSWDENYTYSETSVKRTEFIITVVFVHDGQKEIEEFEDTKGVTRNRKSKKHRQHNGQQKKD